MWGLARSVPKGISCNFCWLPITTSKPLKPGTKRGTRGTKAYYCPARRVYECLRCGTERIRADEARDKIMCQRFEISLRILTTLPAA